VAAEKGNVSLGGSDILVEKSLSRGIPLAGIAEPAGNRQGGFGMMRRANRELAG
jgi:hypothetical protein